MFRRLQTNRSHDSICFTEHVPLISDKFVATTAVKTAVGFKTLAAVVTLKLLAELQSYTCSLKTVSQSADNKYS